MRRLGHFLSYHNAVPIAVSFMLMGAGGVFAATNPEAIYATEQEVVSIDNSYIANKNFSSWTPRVNIGLVTEDEENYYITYELFTIDIVDAVWKDVKKDQTLRVAKGVLGEYGDLGLYATKQLKEVVASELARLKETQEFERRSVTYKTVATRYNGLVGKFLDTKTEELPGYVPVVTPPPPPPKPVVRENPQNEESSQSSQEEPQGEAQEEVAGASDTQEEPSSSESDTHYSLQILGDNPVHVPVGDEYVDLGVVAEFDYEESGVVLFVNGESVSSVSINTSAPGEWRIRYEVVSPTGSTLTATRTVLVFAPSGGSGGGSGGESEGGSEETSSTTPATSTPSTDPTPAVSTTTPPDPAPEPEPVEEEPGSEEEANPEETESAPEPEETTSQDPEPEPTPESESQEEESQPTEEPETPVEE